MVPLCRRHFDIHIFQIKFYYFDLFYFASIGFRAVKTERYLKKINILWCTVLLVTLTIVHAQSLLRIAYSYSVSTWKKWQFATNNRYMIDAYEEYICMLMLDDIAIALPSQCFAIPAQACLNERQIKTSEYTGRRNDFIYLKNKTRIIIILRL